MTQMNLGILLRALELEQTEFLKDAYRFEPCWLVIANYVSLGDQEVFGRQGKKSQAGWIKKIEGKLFGRELAYTWYLCLFFS